MFSRKSNKVFGLLCVAALSLALAAGCTAQTSTEPPTSSSTAAISLLGICSPLACCFPGGGGWQDNPFENELKSLGCTTPSAYTQSYTRSDWWVYSECPLSLEPTNLVLQYSTVAPYYSQLVVNACLELHAVGQIQPTSVFVQWDPTCENCRYRE